MQTPFLVSYVGESDTEQDGALAVDGTGRVYRFCGITLRRDELIQPPKSSRLETAPARFPEFPEAVAVRLPLPSDLSGLRETDLIILENAFELRSDARMMVDVICRLRSECGYRPLIYTPGLADPSNMALLAYMAVDVFDDLYPLVRSQEDICVSSLGELLSAADLRQGEEAASFNRSEAERECRLISYYIRKGRLRELVDMRVASSPWSVAVLRLHDRTGYNLMEERCAFSGDTLSCNTTQSLQRPEIKRFRQKVLSGYRPPEHKRVLVLLPCSARKPYSLSKSHKLFSSAIRTGDHETLVHEVIVTSPLGLVPRELETFYPANAYDIPVTGEWKPEEKGFIHEMLAELLDHGYDVVVNHLGSGYEFLDDLAEMRRTVLGDPTSPASLQHLDCTLREVTAEMPRESYQTDRMNTMRSILHFQFGEAGDYILTGAHVTGKYPFWKIFHGGTQLGMLTGDRGMVSLTLEGAERLMRSGSKAVQIEDFPLKGNLFAVGVTAADPSIRIGDEVAVCYGDELRGVGVALMPGSDMCFLKRGIAVKIRHKKK